jgi:aspartyl/glutamyl-tRNA(Asn/Gln) amidotransferase C subunit
LKTQIFAQVKLSAQGRQHLDEFSEAIRRFPEVLECWVLMGPVDFLLRVVAPDVESYERFFFEIVERMRAVDTRGVEPLYTPLATVRPVQLRLREDAVTEADAREANQLSAPAVQDGLYLVPRVIE